MLVDEVVKILSDATIANRRPGKTSELAEASGRLDPVRISLRLGHRPAFLSNGAYARLSEVVGEVGRMLGGAWSTDLIAPRGPR